MSRDRFGFDLSAEEEFLFGKKPTRRRKKSKKNSKSTKKKFSLTLPTKRLITKEVGKCENCREKKDLEVHHIKKVSDGGTHTLSNLIVLCHNCHKNKAHRGSLSATEQRKKIKQRSKKLQEGIKVILNKAKQRQNKTQTTKKKTTRKKTTKRKPKSPFKIELPDAKYPKF